MAVLGAPESYHGNAVMRRKHSCCGLVFGQSILGCLTIDAAAGLGLPVGCVPVATAAVLVDVVAVAAGFLELGFVLSPLFGARFWPEPSLLSLPGIV